MQSKKVDLDAVENESLRTASLEQLEEDGVNLYLGSEIMKALELICIFFFYIFSGCDWFFLKGKYKVTTLRTSFTPRNSKSFLVEVKNLDL